MFESVVVWHTLVFICFIDSFFFVALVTEELSSSRPIQLYYSTVNASLLYAYLSVVLGHLEQ